RTRLPRFIRIEKTCEVRVSAGHRGVGLDLLDESFPANSYFARVKVGEWLFAGFGNLSGCGCNKADERKKDSGKRFPQETPPCCEDECAPPRQSSSVFRFSFAQTGEIFAQRSLKEPHQKLSIASECAKNSVHSSRESDAARRGRYPHRWCVGEISS